MNTWHLFVEVNKGLGWNMQTLTRTLTWLTLRQIRFFFSSPQNRKISKWAPVPTGRSGCLWREMWEEGAETGSSLNPGRQPANDVSGARVRHLTLLLDVTGWQKGACTNTQASKRIHTDKQASLDYKKLISLCAYRFRRIYNTLHNSHKATGSN